MDGNKDEALRCISIAKEALASGDESRALKFIRISRRLDGNLQVDDLLAACESRNRDEVSKDEISQEKRGFESDRNSNRQTKKATAGSSNGSRDFTDEHVALIRQVTTSKDYYEILGLEKTCSVEEVRKAYRKLSLKVHPDKNKAPGADEAFKIVSKAFKCLSDSESRRRYDQTGLIGDFQFNQQHHMRRRRRRARSDLFDEDFDPDEIFRSFFFGSQAEELFHSAHIYRARHRAREQRGSEVDDGFNFMMALQILPIFAILLFAFLPYSEPKYSLQKSHAYSVPKVTEKFGVEFFVKSPDFDQNLPPGSLSRANLEKQIVKEYRNILARYCHVELQRRHWRGNYPTPHCDKLQRFGEAR